MAVASGAHLLNSCHADYLLLFVIAESAVIDIFQKNLFNYSDAELKIKSAVSFAGFLMSFEFISIWWIQLFTMSMLCSCCFSTIF